MLTTERLFMEKFTPEEIPELMKNLQHARIPVSYTTDMYRNMKRNLIRMQRMGTAGRRNRKT